MIKRTVSWYEYQQHINKICHDISVEKWRPDYIVGLTRGGLLPAAMISHYFNIPMHALSVSLRDHENTESNLWMAEDAWGYGGSFEGKPIFDEYSQKNILIVDDMNDSGATINWIIEDWQNSCLPMSDRWEEVWGNNVKFAVLFDNTASKANIPMSFVSEEINKLENDVWIDFPYEDWWTK